MTPDFIDFISSVGFPITMCLLVYLDMRRIMLEIRDEVRKLNGI